jgi:hypothetical protein
MAGNPALVMDGALDIMCTSSDRTLHAGAWPKLWHMWCSRLGNAILVVCIAVSSVIRRTRLMSYWSNCV